MSTLNEEMDNSLNGEWYHFGQAFAVFLKHSPRSYKEIAEFSEVTEETLKNWRRGRVKRPQWEDIVRVSAAMLLAIPETNILLSLADRPSFSECQRRLDDPRANIPNREKVKEAIKKILSTKVSFARDISDNYIKHIAFRPPLERPPRPEHFQGREIELAKLLNDLQPGRVVTLCGPGGIGKTALAAEAIWQLAPNDQLPDRFPDGIIYHSFYKQSQVALAIEHIASSFGEELRPTPTAAVQRALSGRRVLLFLDGVEEADDLPTILNLRDRCAVLVTSRRRSDAIAERQNITSLPLDAAIALLKAWGKMRANDDLAVCQISELVGRLPLALRLAGHYLSANEENAADYLSWLEATPLDALDHEQRQSKSVPLLLTRSLAQVSKLAQQVLSVVGILALAPFTQEMIATGPIYKPLNHRTIVVQAGSLLNATNIWSLFDSPMSIDRGKIRKALGELVNFGLLLRPEDNYEVTHALIHIYVREKLSPSSEVIDQFINYFTQFIEKHEENFVQLDLLRPHIRALLPIYLKQSAWNEISTLVASVSYYLDLQGHWADWIAILNTGLIAVRALQDRENEANYLGTLGYTYYLLGQDLRAITHHEQALAISKEVNDRIGEARHLGNLGTVYAALKQMDQAVKYYEQALTIAREICDRRGEGSYLGSLGQAYHSLGQVEQAMTYQKQALIIAKETNNLSNEGDCLSALGDIHISQGQTEQAITYHEQALAIAKKMGDLAHEGGFLDALGRAYTSLGQIEQAITYHEQALAITKKIEDHQNEIIELGRLGPLYAELKQTEQAITYYKRAITLAKETGNYEEGSINLVNLGNAYYSLEQPEQARQVWEEALHIFEQIKSPKALIVKEYLKLLTDS